jgi:hypothetical protein
MDSACPSFRLSVKRDDRNHAVEMTAAADITTSDHATYGIMNDTTESLLRDYGSTNIYRKVRHRVHKS